MTRDNIDMYTFKTLQLYSAKNMFTVYCYIQDRDTQCTIQCLNTSNSKVIKEWKETDKKITFCYNEARDNSKFIQAIETSCHALYLDDPVNMKESILGLLQTVRLIYSVSQFYNTSERTSSLMVKVRFNSDCKVRFNTFTRYFDT